MIQPRGDHMKLSYRGASYEYTPPTLEVTEGEIIGRYRGQILRRHTARNAPPQPIVELKYRGVSYYTDRSGGVNTAVRPQAKVNAVTPTTAPAAKAAITAPSALRRAKEEWLQVHRSNLRQNLERRLQVAKERGDQNLVNQLESELQYIA
jgi:hypothetical protein